MIKVSCVLFFSTRRFLKEIHDMFSVFLSSYKNSLEILGELENALEKLASRFVFPHGLLHSRKLLATRVSGCYFAC